MQDVIVDILVVELSLSVLENENRKCSVLLALSPFVLATRPAWYRIPPLSDHDLCVVIVFYSLVLYLCVSCGTRIE